MKLLFNQNISFKLTNNLADLYPNSEHVRSLGLDKSDDRKMWDFARDEGFTIVTKDEDFHQMSFLNEKDGSFLVLGSGEV